MVYLTAARYEVDAAVAYHGGETEKYLGEVGGLEAPTPAQVMGVVLWYGSAISGNAVDIWSA